MGKQARLNAAKNAGKLDYVPYNPDDDLRFVDNTNYAPLPCGPVVTPEAQNADNVICHFPTESGFWTVLGPRNHMRRAEVVTSMHLYRGTSVPEPIKSPPQADSIRHLRPIESATRGR